jgi:hypothetical protein
MKQNPDVAEFIIGRAFARPVGSSGLRLLSQIQFLLQQILPMMANEFKVGQQHENILV